MVDRKLERAIVLVLLSEEGEPRCPCARLAAELDAELGALHQALDRLSEAGVVCVEDTDVWAARASRHLDELGLVAI
jgi:DNA-binding MarR family transcriptional regulator